MGKKLTNDQKIGIGIAATVLTALAGKGIYELLPSTKEKRQIQKEARIKAHEEWEKATDALNAAIDAELSKRKTFSQGDLIGKLVDSKELGSGLKCELISTIKQGKNPTDDSMNKAIYKIAMNPRIRASDTMDMIHDIMNAHPKTDSEIICDTITNISDSAIKLLANKVIKPNKTNTEAEQK